MFVNAQSVRRPNGKTYTYHRLVRSYREGGKTKHEVLCELGRLTPEEAAKLARGFARIAGQPLTTDGDVEVNGTRLFGAPLLVEHLMEVLGLDACLRKALQNRRVRVERVIAAVRLMLCAHLFKSGSRAELAVWDWQQKLLGFGGRHPDVSYLGLLRALRLVVASKEEVEKALYSRLVDLFGVEVDVVFYDLTSTFVEGQALRSARLKRGYNRDGRGDCKQIVLGLVVTREGFPLTCRVFDGNTLDAATLATMVEDLRRRFEVRGCIWVSDTGLLSASNLKMLDESGYDFILGCGNGSRKDVAEAVAQTRRAPDAVVKDVRLWDVPVGEAGRHIVIVESEGRQAKTCAILERRLRRVRERFGALARQAVHGKGLRREALLIEAEKALHASSVSKYFTYEAQDGHFAWREDAQAVAARQADAGKYGLLTNAALGAEEVLTAYRTLLVVEDAFWVLKNELDLRPLWHRDDVQIEGHVLLAMWSYLLHKTVEVELERHAVALSTADALEAVGEVRAVEVALREKPIWKLMHMRPEAENVLLAVGIAHPKAAFNEWAAQAPPYRYDLRKVPWPGNAADLLDI
jgi:hypothetical protein